jgi:hypothetical protein
MQQLVHADFFFFATTIVMVVLSIPTLIALIYLIIILRNLKDFSERAKEEGMAVLDGVSFVRHFVKEKQNSLASLFNLFSLVHKKKSRIKKKEEKILE